MILFRSECELNRAFWPFYFYLFHLELYPQMYSFINLWFVLEWEYTHKSQNKEALKFISFYYTLWIWIYTV